MMNSAPETSSDLASRQTVSDEAIMLITKLMTAGALALMLSLMAEAKTNVTSEPYGKMPDGTPIEIYTLSDGRVEARIMTYGGIVVSLKVPDRQGKAADIVLGFDNLEGYVAHNNGKGPAYIGAVIGRYANRIAHATFTLDGKKYDVPKNDGDNSLHSGIHGFNNVVWQGKPIADGVELTYVSKDGENGFPGNLTTVVRYTLAKGALRIEYSATTDKNTVLNLTNHSYFNLAGQGSGEILAHQLLLHASRFTPVDATLIPTGEMKSVTSTPFDFGKPTAIGGRIDADDEQLRLGHGYDHNWVLDNHGRLAEAAEVYEPNSGRVLRVSTDQPGIQVYTGNFLNGSIKGKSGVSYQRRTALCLETQHFPDSPNHPSFPTSELRVGQNFHSVTIFSFSTR
jgi:aldose 1-epimerase